MAGNKTFKPIKDTEWDKKKATIYDTIAFYDTLKTAMESMNIRVRYDCGLHYFRIEVINPFKGESSQFILTKIQGQGSSPESICRHFTAVAKDAMEDIAKQEQQLISSMKDNEEISAFFTDEQRQQILNDIPDWKKPAWAKPADPASVA